MRYKNLLEDLKSSVNCGRDEYPTTLASAFDLLVRESGDTVQGSNPIFCPCRPCGGRGRNSFFFAQQGREGRGNCNNRVQFSWTNGTNSDELVADNDGETHPCIACFGCYFIDHYRDQCHYATPGNVQAMHVGHMLTQGTFSKSPRVEYF